MQLAASPSNYPKLLVLTATSIPSPSWIRLCTPPVMVFMSIAGSLGFSQVEAGTEGCFTAEVALKVERRRHRSGNGVLTQLLGLFWRTYRGCGAKS